MSREHVGIRCTDINLLRERMWVSSVVAAEVIAQESGPDFPPYIPDAMVPDVRDMRKPTDDELELFLATDETPDAGLVEIVPPSRVLKDALKKIRQAPGHRYLEPIVCAANQLTTTPSGQAGLRQGIHFDDPDSLVAERMDGVRRLGFNRGPSTRFLLLGSVDIFDMWSQYGNNDPGFVPGSETIGQYAMSGGEVICAHLAIEPYASYIANVRAAAHEASTDGQGPSTVHFEDGVWEPGVFGSLI